MRRLALGVTPMLVIVAALLWITPPAAADSECRREDGSSFVSVDLLKVEPPGGQYPGAEIRIDGTALGYADAFFFFNGEVIGSLDSTFGDYSFSATVPDLPSGDYYITSHWISTSFGNRVADCRNVYTVLFNISGVVTVPTAAIIDDATVATTPPVTAAMIDDAIVATTAAVAPPATAASTPGAVEDSTPPPELTSEASDTTLVAAAPQPADGATNGLLIGLLIGLGIAAIAASAYGFGRRARTTPKHYQQPPPPPPS